MKRTQAKRNPRWSSLLQLLLVVATVQQMMMRYRMMRIVPSWFASRQTRISSTANILVVKLIAAHNLIAVDWNGSSDPYAIISLSTQSARSSVQKKQLNPIWNETMMFWIDLEGATQVGKETGKMVEDVVSSSAASSSSNGSNILSIPDAGVRARSESSNKKRIAPNPTTRTLSVMLFDHDWIRHDETLGWCEIPLDQIPRSKFIEKTFSLEGVKNGTVTLSLQRATLTSPPQKSILRSLVALGRPIKSVDLSRKSVTLGQLLGREPYIHLPDELDKERMRREGLKEGVWSKQHALVQANGFGGNSIRYLPALSHLASLIVNPSSKFSIHNKRTLQKVLFILKTQAVVDLPHDLPSRYLWFTNLNTTDRSPSALFLLLRKYFPNRLKRMVIPRSGKQGCAYVWFKRTEDAILALLTMLDMRPLRACFGQAFEPQEGHLLFDSLKAGILNIAGPFESPNMNTELSRNNQEDQAAIAEAASDELPPPINAASTGSNSKVPSMGRQNSNCNNDAPQQKGKHEMNWSSYWVFVSAPDASANKPAVLYALRKTSDFNAEFPEDSKWAFKVELTKQACVVVRSGAWSIEVIMLQKDPDHSGDPEASKSLSSHRSNRSISGVGALQESEEEQKAGEVPSVNPSFGRRLTIPASPISHRTIYIRASSTGKIEEWLALLKACRNGEEILSPKPKQREKSAEEKMDEAAAAGEVLEYSETPYYSEVATRVYCSSCKTKKNVLDIYTLDAALDVTPQHLEASPRGSPLPPPHPASSPPPAAANSAAPAALPVPTPITQFTIHSCRDCLTSRIQSRIAKQEFELLAGEFSIQDLQDLLSRKQFTEYLDKTTANLISSLPKRFVRCPKCECPLEMENHSWSSKSENLLVSLVGLDRQPLDDGAKAFFLANRFLCRGCRTDFCRACRTHPFHPGFTCEEYVAYLAAPKCRFCSMTVTAKTKYTGEGGLAFPEVCNSAECAEKVAQSCCTILRCGHPCGGARDELDCPPCLFEDCESRDPKVNECREDECAICYTEELGQAPVIRLSCNHFFHVSCTRARLNAKWSSSRISFEFMRCPLCNVKMQHPLLTDLLRPMYHMESEVRQLSLQRLEFEALTDHVDIVSPEGRYYQNPEEFAYQHYMFYQCYTCQEPYFAGARACGAAGAEEVKREDLVCGGCSSVSSFDTCPTHGTGFLIFKCRFCCTFSTYFWSIKVAKHKCIQIICRLRSC